MSTSEFEIWRKYFLNVDGKMIKKVFFQEHNNKLRGQIANLFLRKGESLCGISCILIRE